MAVTSSSVIGYLFPDSPFEYGLLYLKAVSYHSLTHKPVDYKNNRSHITVINLLSKDFLKRRKLA